MEYYIRAGELREIRELYYPVRLKPKGENSLANLKQGVDHIELRMLDLNPFSPVGISKEDLDFLQLFLFYLAAQEDMSFSEKKQKWALQNAKKAAEFDDRSIRILTGNGTSVPLRELALRELLDMERFYQQGNQPSAVRSIQYQQKKIQCPHKRYAEKVQKEYGHHFVRHGIHLAKIYAEKIGEEVPIYV